MVLRASSPICVPISPRQRASPQSTGSWLPIPRPMVICAASSRGLVQSDIEGLAVRKFIDPNARFKFVPAKGYQPQKGEVRFDMFEAEFTHDGDLCTFEVLVERFGLVEPAFQSIAEIVHDVNVKDAKYGREDAPGVGQVVAGIAAAHADDEARLERGNALFDDLYALHRIRPAR